MDSNGYNVSGASRRFRSSGRSRILFGGVAVLGLVGTMSLAGCADNSLSLDVVDHPSPWVVGMGDSYMSGEAGRWVTNGVDNAAENAKIYKTGIGWKVGDSQDVYDTPGFAQDDGCHRTVSAPMVVGDGFKSVNLACSGAITSSLTNKKGKWKPGIDFNDRADGARAQATMLEEFAKSHDVKVVALSIGGNDMGFGNLVKACTKAYVTPFVGGHCSTDKNITKLVSNEAKVTLISKIEGAIKNVVQAMTNAGYASSQWRMTYQLPPGVLPLPNDTREKGSGYVRQDKCGLPFKDEDLEWAVKTVQPFLKSAIQDAVTRSRNLVPITMLDTDQLLDGHRLCEKGATQSRDGVGQNPSYSELGRTTEWVRRINVSEQKFPFAQKVEASLTEPMHPMYWGQRALAQCTLAAIGSPRNTMTETCSLPAGGGTTNSGDPVVTAVATPWPNS